MYHIKDKHAIIQGTHLMPSAFADLQKELEEVID